MKLDGAMCVLSGSLKKVWRCLEKEQAVYQKGPRGLPEPAGEELSHLHGVPQASSQVSEIIFCAICSVID